MGIVLTDVLDQRDAVAQSHAYLVVPDLAGAYVGACYGERVVGVAVRVEANEHIGAVAFMVSPSEAHGGVESGALDAIGCDAYA